MYIYIYVYIYIHEPRFLTFKTKVSCNELVEREVVI